MLKSHRSLREIQCVNNSTTEKSGTGQIRIGEYIIYYKGMENRHNFDAGFAILKDYIARVSEINPLSE